MSFKVFVDDIRPVPNGFDIVLRTYDEAHSFILTNAKNIEHISFDHDLSEVDEMKTGYHLACLFEEMLLEENKDILEMLTKYESQLKAD